MVSPKLYELERMGDKVCVSLLVILINDIADALNIGKNMSAQQVIDAAQILYDEFPQAKVNDIVFCFNKAKRGHYGTIYDRLDVHVLLEWLHKYFDAQIEQIEGFRQRENNVLKRETKAMPLLPDPKDKVSENSEYWISKIKQELNKKPVIEKKVNKVEAKPDRFSKWMAQFNRIHFKHDNGQGGTRFVKRGGRMMDITEFLHYKQWQMDIAADRKFKKISIKNE